LLRKFGLHFNVQILATAHEAKPLQGCSYWDKEEV
jgi:hypothetical protein